MNKNTYASDALYNAVGSIIYFFCLWLITVIVVRVSGFDNAGILSVAMTVANIFYVLANYGMRSFQASDINCIYSNEDYIGSRIVTVLVSFFLCVCFCFIFRYDFMHTVCVTLFMLYKEVEAFADVLYGVLQRHHKLRLAGVSMTLRGVGSVIVFAVSLLILQKLWAAIGAMTVYSFIVLCLYDFKQMNGYVNEISNGGNVRLFNIRKLMTECLAMFIVSICPMILQAIPKLQFERIYTLEDMGIYASVSSPTVVITTLISCIMIPFLPMYATYISEGKIGKLFKLHISFIGMVTLTGVIALVFSKYLGTWALQILYGDGLENCTLLLIYVVISVILACYLYCFNAFFIAGRKLGQLATVYIATDILAIYISPKLIVDRKVYGITDTLIIIQVIQCIVLAVMSIQFFIKRIVRKE